MLGVNTSGQERKLKLSCPPDGQYPIIIEGDITVMPRSAFDMRTFVSIILVLTAIVAGAFAGGDKSPRYQDFSVTNIFKGKPAAVDLSSDPQARTYRTQLRRQAAEGPNFAGHYKIAIWGCGSSCQQFAIVDSQTGRVYFPPELPFVTYVHWYGDDVGLQFRLDSKLLVLHGSPKEEPSTGTFYYVWQTNTLRLIHVDLKKDRSDEKPAA